MAQDIFEPGKSGFGIPELEAKNNGEHTADDGPDHTRDKELPGDHFVILAEYILGDKCFMMVVLMMCIMAPMNICPV
jgi:hypothetical protein